MSGAMSVTSSSSVMPQMAAYFESIEMLVRLLMVEKMLSCENLVMPVMKQKRISASFAFNWMKNSCITSRNPSNNSGRWSLSNSGASYSSMMTATCLPV